jgi:predicted HTH domain antitoxin
VLRRPEMEVLLRVPDDIAEKLEAGSTNLPRWALEALAAAAYRSGRLTAAEVQRMLGLSSRWEADEILKRAGAFLDYTEDDLHQDIETLRRLSAR